MKLRHLRLEDAPLMLEWMTADDVEEYFRFDKNQVSLESCRRFILNGQNNNENRHYAITQDGGEYLGTISLKNIDFQNKNAELAISLRGIARGKGLGTSAIQEVIKIAFNELLLHKIYLNVLSNNTRAINLYKKVGFSSEGELIDHVFINGQYRNLRLFGVYNDKTENN